MWKYLWTHFIFVNKSINYQQVIQTIVLRSNDFFLTSGDSGSGTGPGSGSDLTVVSGQRFTFRLLIEILVFVKNRVILVRLPG